MLRVIYKKKYWADHYFGYHGYAPIGWQCLHPQGSVVCQCVWFDEQENVNHMLWPLSVTRSQPNWTLKEDSRAALETAFSINKTYWRRYNTTGSQQPIIFTWKTEITPNGWMPRPTLGCPAFLAIIPGLTSISSIQKCFSVSTNPPTWVAKICSTPFQSSLVILITVCSLSVGYSV
jgi:hypothetical protein